MRDDETDHLSRVARELEDLRAIVSKLRGAIVLGRTKSPVRAADNEPESPVERAPLTILESAAATLAALRNSVRAVQSDHRVVAARLEAAERVAWEQKVRRAVAAARFQDRDARLKEIEQSRWWRFVKPFWKLSRARKTAAEVAPSAGSSDFEFGIELPHEWRTSREILLVKGWCVSRSGREIAGVRAKVGTKGRIARYGLRRDAKGDGSDTGASSNDGFTVELRVPRGRTKLRLEAIVLGSDWELFFEHELIGENTGAPDDAPLSETHEGQPIRRTPRRFPGISAGAAAKLLKPEFEKRGNEGAPFISVLTPTFNTRPDWFAEAAMSLLDQTFANWEWCVVDDASTSRETKKLLINLAKVCPRLRIEFGTHGGISAATNAALALATGEYVCLLDHDDLLDPLALTRVAAEAQCGADVVYTDEDKLDEKTGKLVEPFHKPDWSPEYFRGVMYVGHLLCVRRSLAAQVRFDSAFDGVQDFEFMLRVSETGAKIAHVPAALYHWRKTAGSIAEKPDAKPEIDALQARAVNAHLARLGLAARAELGDSPHRLKIVPAARKHSPPISIIIPTKDAPEMLERCLSSIADRTSYPDFEVLLVDNQTTDAKALRIMEEFSVRRIPFAEKFNFSRANNLAAEQAASDFLVFLNNDTEILEADWLQHLLYYAEQPDLGAAGTLLLYDDQTVQHAGVVLGMRGTADHVMRRFPPDVDGYAGSLACAREVSAVTGACLMIRKARFESIGGFNEHFATAYQDVDLCLRLRAQGLRNIYTPAARMLHHESVSRQHYYDMVDRMLLLDQWEDVIALGDPYFSRHFDTERGDYSLRRPGK